MNHPAPSKEVKLRIMRSIDAAPAPSRAQESYRAMLVLTGAFLVALIVFEIRGGIRATHRPPSLMAGTAFGSLLVAGLGVFLLVGHDGKMSGRPRSRLVLAMALLPLSFFAWKVLYSAQFAHAMDIWVTRIGFRCLGLSLSMALAPLLALIYVRRGTEPQHPALSGAAIGVAVGLIAAALVDLWCPVAYVPHLLLGHILPIVILGILGLLIGTRSLRV